MPAPLPHLAPGLPLCAVPPRPGEAPARPPIVARTYLKFAYVYGYHLPEARQPFFDWKVKGVEEEVSKLSNMMEDLYRHDIRPGAPGVAWWAGGGHGDEATLSVAL